MQKANPNERLTFYGMEKNPTTIRLAKMNLAVYGLEGNIQKAITYYEDPHELVGKADFVVANPPFNVDEIDAGKVKGDPRLPFGLPSVTKAKGPKKKKGEAGGEKKKESAGRISNGNYVWISFFYSYLNETGRAGFVMSSQASSAGRSEATIRENLVKTGDVEAMIAIRSNFFYTRTVPCELWFFNRAKPEAHRDTVLMIDARNIFRKVTRKIYDFSPEQEKNLLAVVWLHRGESARFFLLVSDYLEGCIEAAEDCFREGVDEDGPMAEYRNAVTAFRNEVQPFLDSLEKKDRKAEAIERFLGMKKFPVDGIAEFRARVDEAGTAWSGFDLDSEAEGFRKFLADVVEPLSNEAKALSKELDGFQKVCGQLVETCEKSLEAKESERWFPREVSKALKQMGEARQVAAEKLKRIRYFRRQAAWLLERFPDGKYRDVEGLVKRVDRAEIEANDWSLTPGRYVGVAPEEVDEDFDFEEAMREIHGELAELNVEAEGLATRIQRNFEGLRI
jgi:type I restriction enzyme M protein